MAKPRKSAVSFKNRLETTFATMPSETVRVGFSSIDMWVSMGNYAMNRINSGRWDTAWLFGRNYVLYGDSGSGKSLFAALMAAEAQRAHGALIIWLDVEKATDDEAGKKWLARTGLDMDNLLYVSCAGLEEIKRLIAETAKELRTNLDVEPGEKADPVQPVVIIVDSWAAAQPKTALQRTVKGELVGDQGQKAKQTGEVILSTTHLSSGIPLLVVGIQHIQDNQDGHGRAHKTTGGHKMVYYASGCMLYTKRELRVEDVDDPEHLAQLRSVTAKWSANLKKSIGLYSDAGHVVGVSIIVENLKSRAAKPFQRIEVQVPYQFGVDKYSGLFEVMLYEQAIRPAKSAGYYEYMDPDVTENGGLVRISKKQFREHADRIMALQPADISDPTAMRKEFPVEAEADADAEAADAAITEAVSRLRKKTKKIDPVPAVSEQAEGIGSA